MAIDPQNFQFIRDLVLDKSGIVLDEGKEYLVESRLVPLVNKEGFSSLDELFGRLQSERYNGLHARVIEAMTTNETSFFRDVHPFNALKEGILPELIAHRTAERAINVWCGACSSGQEPYTFLMMMRESFPQLATWNVKLIATDLCEQMLERTRDGLYTQLEVNRGLPAALLVKYFQKKGIKWQAREELRDSIETMQLNLIATWPFLAPMDIVFMRNVLIYFGVEKKKEILGKIRRVLKPDGYLFLGGTETTINLDENFERVDYGRSWCYRLRA